VTVPAGRPTTARRLVLAAHGGTDAGYATAIEAIAGATRHELHRRGLLGIDVLACYLDHLQPSLRGLTTRGDIVVPLLLSTGYHATVDIPAAAPDAAVAGVLGPDPRLAAACADRLLCTGWTNRTGGPVVLAATGSSDAAAGAQVAAAAAALARLVGVPVIAATLSAGSPRLEEVVAEATAVVPFLLAPGRFADQAKASGAPYVADVIGDHPAVAAIVVDRYVAAVAEAELPPDGG
jgi:sirohydrochlorin ferrochelatase